MNQIIHDRNIPHDSFARQRALGRSRFSFWLEEVRLWLLADFMPDLPEARC